MNLGKESAQTGLGYRKVDFWLQWEGAWRKTSWIWEMGQSQPCADKRDQLG